MGIVVADVVGDFCADPVGKRDSLIGIVKLDFSDDEAGVIAGENIDLPCAAIVRHKVARFFDEGVLAEMIEHVVGIGDGDGVFELGAGEAGAFAFDRDVGLLPGNAHPYGAAGLQREIALAKWGAANTLDLAPFIIA